ncbi:MAG TPA: hypothetical protein VGQ76_13340, partial [Thermoanaerobaculia bacterium]|nr:hypothetical protein [Thermoanaerobaculia bacterium]
MELQEEPALHEQLSRRDILDTSHQRLLPTHTVEKRRIAVFFLLSTVVIVAVGLITVQHYARSPFASLSFDSIRYYAGAESILANGRYLGLDGHPQQHWPPGMAILYAAASRVAGRDALTLVSAVNTSAYVLTITALALLLYRTNVR